MNWSFALIKDILLENWGQRSYLILNKILDFHPLIQKDYLEKCTLFPIVNWAISHCFYKSAEPGLKIEARNSFFWILVRRMIAIHHCAKEQFAWLIGVQMWASDLVSQALISEIVAGGQWTFFGGQGNF